MATRAANMTEIKNVSVSIVPEAAELEEQGVRAKSY